MKEETIFIALGYIGSLSCIVQFFPQVYLTVSTDKTDDLSIKSVCLNLFTQCCIFPYSLYFKLYPIAIANFSLGICDIILIAVYLKNKYFKHNTSSSSLLP